MSCADCGGGYGVNVEFYTLGVIKHTHYRNKLMNIFLCLFYIEEREREID